MVTLEGNAELLAGFQRGDKAALTTIYRAYVSSVASTLRRGVRVNVDGQATRLGANPAESDVEVLLQETFIRAFSASARASYDGVRPFGAYLGTIARNLVIDRARAAKRHAAIVQLDDDEGASAAAEAHAASATDPLWPIEENELRRSVAEAVAALSAREREIYDLRYQRGLGQREVAQKLGLAVITVRRIDVVIRHRILEHLRANGHMRDASIGIPRLARDRNSG